MTNCTQESFQFPVLKRRIVEVNFQGGDISSDGGVLLLQQVDRRLGLSEALAHTLNDPRRQASVEHNSLSLLRQRVYALALGYEDLNDHQSLRLDLAIQTALGRTEELASGPTLCRWENRADRETAVRMHEVIVEQFIASFKKVPKKLILDFDATDDRVHGNQEGRFFHGYYDHYCFLPLYVFCRNQLLVSYLRESKIDGARHAWAILALLVKRLRQTWPQVKIILRGDSGFCRWKMLSWCERKHVGYIVGIARIEHTDKGSNPRYVVTNLKGEGKTLYDKLYCARGEMENRIKEQQLDLFADRTSCHRWWPNQFRLLLSSLAYMLLEAIRRLTLQGTELANAYVGTLRLKLLKVGAIILRNTRRIRFLLSSAYPHQRLFFLVAARLAPG